MKVSDVMSKPVHSLSGGKTARDVAQLLGEKKISCVIVTKKYNVLKPVSDLGVVTERDIIMKVVSENKNPSETLLSEIMARPVICVPPDTALHEVNSLMLEHDIRRMFIIEDDSIIGVVTQRDILGNLKYSHARSLLQLED